MEAVRDQIVGTGIRMWVFRRDPKTGGVLILQIREDVDVTGTVLIGCRLYKPANLLEAIMPHIMELG